MIKDIPYIRSIMFVSSTAPARYERAGLFEKIRLSTSIVRGLSGYMEKHRDDSGGSEQRRELMEYQRKQNAFRCDMALSELWRHYTAFLADGYAAEKAKAQAFLQERLDAQIAIHEKNLRNAEEWKAREIADWDRSAKYFQINETHRDNPRWASYYTHVDAKAARRAQQRAEGVKQYDDMIVTNEATLEKLRAGDHSLLVGSDHLLYTLERVIGDARETLAEHGGLDAGELDEAFAETERDAELHDIEEKVAEAPPVAVTDAPAAAPAPPALQDRTEPKSDADPKRIPSALIPSVWTPGAIQITDNAVTENELVDAVTRGVERAQGIDAKIAPHDVLDLTGIDLSMDRKHLRPVDWDSARVKTFDVWVRPNGTGKVRAFSGENLDGVIVDFGDVEVPLRRGRPGFYFANLNPEQVKEIRG